MGDTSVLMPCNDAPGVPPWVWGTEARGFWGLSAQTRRDNPEVTQVPHLSTFYPLKYLPLLCFFHYWHTKFKSEQGALQVLWTAGAQEALM